MENEIPSATTPPGAGGTWLDATRTPDGAHKGHGAHAATRRADRCGRHRNGSRDAQIQLLCDEDDQREEASHSSLTIHVNPADHDATPVPGGPS